MVAAAAARGRDGGDSLLIREVAAKELRSKKSAHAAKQAALTTDVVCRFLLLLDLMRPWLVI